MLKNVFCFFSLILFFSVDSYAESTNTFPTNTALSYILSTNDISFFSKGAVRFKLKGNQNLLKVVIPKYDFSKHSVKIKLTNINDKGFDIIFRSFEPLALSLPSLKMIILSNLRTNISLTPSIILKNSHPITNKIKSPAPPEDIIVIRDWLMIFLILIPLLLGIAVFFIYRYIKKRRQFGGDTLKRKNPFEKIKQSLCKIRLDSNVRKVYEELSRIVRYLIEAGFGINAPELATSEIIRTLKKESERHEVNILIEHILKQCDRVLYAKHPAGFEQLYTSFTESYELLYALADKDSNIIHPIEKLKLLLDDQSSSDGKEGKTKISTKDFLALLTEIYHIDLNLKPEKRNKIIPLIEKNSSLREALNAWFEDMQSEEKRNRLIELLTIYKSNTEDAS